MKSKPAKPGGKWPQRIDFPTASGKTACIDIAIYALAAQADCLVSERTAPRRIWFVVDRRIVVDEAYDRAGQIADKLREAKDGSLKIVAERLRQLSGLAEDARPLATARLRGGVLKDDGWARIPSQPALIVAMASVSLRPLSSPAALKKSKLTIRNFAHCVNSVNLRPRSAKPLAQANRRRPSAVWTEKAQTRNGQATMQSAKENIAKGWQKCYPQDMASRDTSALWQEIEKRFFLIAGPCVIESESLCLDIAAFLAKTCQQLGIRCVFKASYDKANRSSAKSFRGPGLEAGLAALETVRTKHGLPLLTDVHTESEAAAAGAVVDILQIPAFLSRQTDLLQAAAKTGRIINVKKGQSASPQEMKNVANKLAAFGNRRFLLTERGAAFGYHNLVADMRSIPIMQQLGCPVVFDATHSVQLPGADGSQSGGQREFAPILAKAAVAAGANGIFMETHPEPEKALSDGPNMIPLCDLPQLLGQLLAIRRAVKPQNEIGAG